MMRCFVSQNQYDSDEHIPLLAGAYRSSPHTSTGLTPNKLMLGREVYRPEEVIWDCILWNMTKAITLKACGRL